MSTIKILFEPQDPTSTVDYQIDFSAELAEESPLIITSLVWSVLAIQGDTAPLIIVAQRNAPDMSSTIVRVQGGTLDWNYLVRCARQWSDGESDVVSFELPIGYT